jgi:hypothetical protein
MGGAWSVQVVVDEEREVYAAWGLGISTTYHLLNPWTQIARNKLGKEEGNWGREVDPSGNRWQIGGAWSTDEYESSLFSAHDQNVFFKGYQSCSCSNLFPFEGQDTDWR